MTKCSSLRLRSIKTPFTQYIFTFQHVLTDNKSGTMLFFKLIINRYGLGLSNEPFFIIIAQGAAKQNKQKHFNFDQKVFLFFLKKYFIKIMIFLSFLQVGTQNGKEKSTVTISRKPQFHEPGPFSAPKCQQCQP